MRKSESIQVKVMKKVEDDQKLIDIIKNDMSIREVT